MDKATSTALKSMNRKWEKEQVLKRVEEKEFIQRCNAVRVCHKCGRDWVDIEAFSSHHVSLACENKRCSEYNKVKSHTYPNGQKEES